MAFYHGIKTRQVETSISTPVTAGSGVAFVVGTAPAHTVGGQVNAPIMALTYEEAVSALGYSDNWEKYSLCEVIYSQFQLYNISPVFFVNVLDPAKHKTAVAAADMELIEKKVLLPLEAIESSVKVKESGDGGAEYAVNEDYGLFYEGENLVLEVLEGGAIPESAAKLNIAFEQVDPSKVTDAEIIGGFNVATKKTSGFELIDSVFPKFGIAPDILICPGWSHKTEVAAIMSAKAQSINGLFEAKALIDIDTTAVTYYSDAPEWKKAQNINAKTQVLCFPMVKLGEKVFHLSTQAAGLMGKVDADNGDCPCESPSNKLLQANAAVLADGTEVLLDLQQANYLNSNGIVTVLNLIGGFSLWGNHTACFPANTDVKDYFISVSRMFGWVSNSVILTYWSKIDKKLNRRLIDSIVDSINIWLNGLVSEEKLLGGRVEFREEENNTAALMEGKAVFHIFMTPASPAQEIEFVLEYDVDYVTAAFAA
ncbi:phage tail sheath family protein [Enterocloster aldenensis]|uniref:phage tail sheath family protein n=1 Tax=Enterocloster aldenensis TaxID=358742 RepID=UPI0040298647